MPYNNGDPSYPVGLCVDYNYTRQLVIGEKAIPAAPVLMTLTSEGVLCSFRLINTNIPDSLATPVEALGALPPFRSNSLVNLKGAQINTPKPETAKPLLFSTPSANLAAKPTASSYFAAPPSSSLFATPSFASTPTPSLASTLGFAPKPTLANLGGTAASLAPKSTPTLSLPPSKTEATKSDSAQSVKSPLTRKPSLPVSPKPTDKPVVKNSQENQANLDHIFAKSIDDEVKTFSHQLDQHKASTERLEDVKDILTKEGLTKVAANVTNLEKKLSNIHSLISNVNKDVSTEKDVLLVALASLEETKGYYNCYNDPSYIALLKSKPLDKMTRKLRDDIFSKYAQMQNLVDELNVQLDTEWENMHSSKKSTPSSRTIYKTLSQHRVISNEQEKTVDTLLKQLGNLNIRTTNAKPAAASPKRQPTKSISPAKQRILKGLFENRVPTSKVVTSPAKFNISSLSASYNKPKLLPSPDETAEYEQIDFEKENVNIDQTSKPEPVKMGIPTLKYSEKPKFDLDDPTKYLGGDEKVPSVVLKYMPTKPQVILSEEEKVKGAQELVSKLMDFAQKEKDTSSTTDKSFSQQFVPVMRTKGPVAPGQAPNAVIQPVSAFSGSTRSPSNVLSSTAAPSFALGKPSTSTFGGLSQPSSGLFGTYTSTSKTPVVDAKSIFGGMGQPVASTGSLFAPVSTPPLNISQKGSSTTPILVTPKATTPPQANIFGTLKPGAGKVPQSSPGGDSFPVVGVPAAQFDKNRDASSPPAPDFTRSYGGASLTKTNSAVPEEAAPVVTPTNPALETKSSPKSNFFTAAPSSTNIFAMANAQSAAAADGGGNIFTAAATNPGGGIFGGSGGGSTAGFFAPVATKDSSPSIGGSLVSSQEKSPATPPRAAVAPISKEPATTPLPSTGLFASETEKPASAKNLFGSAEKSGKKMRNIKIIVTRH